MRVHYYWPIVPAPDDTWWWVWSSGWKYWQGKPKYAEKTCSNAVMSTTNPITWPVLEPGPPRWEPGDEPSSGGSSGRFSQGTSALPANNSTYCATFIIIHGWYSRPNGGRLDKWTQSGPTSRKNFSSSVQIWKKYFSWLIKIPHF
jgi:hypothetical protein